MPTLSPEVAAKTASEIGLVRTAVPIKPSYDDLLAKLADDSYAVPFRSLGEYRIELLKFARGEA